MGRTSVPEVFFQSGLDVTGGQPMDSVRHLSTQELVQIYERIKTIAVVGASADETKTANVIPSYLQSQGYRILPVNPRGGEILGERAYATLQDVDLPIDVVDVFRPPAEAEAVARAAIAKGVAILWFQPGTHTDQAAALAADAGLTVVTGRCMGALHAALGLGPGPSTQR
jgi:predicted CoA-binding protein